MIHPKGNLTLEVSFNSLYATCSAHDIINLQPISEIFNIVSLSDLGIIVNPYCVLLLLDKMKRITTHSAKFSKHYLDGGFNSSETY